MRPCGHVMNAAWVRSGTARRKVGWPVLWAFAMPFAYAGVVEFEGAKAWRATCLRAQAGSDACCESVELRWEAPDGQRSVTA